MQGKTEQTVVDVELEEQANRKERSFGPALTGILFSALVLALVFLSWAMEQPPPPVHAGAPPEAFSAERAGVHLETLARHPTPIGSAENEQVRRYLVDQMADLGLEVRTQSGVGAWTFGSHSEVGRVTNVIARLPGRDPTGQVIVSGHFDTVPNSPGASDDKGSVAAILETARALTLGSFRNDVIFLLTDGEEPGLLGASLYARTETPGVVVNWEGYGSHGPAVMFHTSEGNAQLIGEFARSAPHPAGSSPLAELYALASNNTDFTALEEAGFIGLEWSLLDGIAHYHSPTDSVETLDPASLQHLGENMLGMTKGLADRDLSTLVDEADRIYFTLFGHVLALPAGWTWWLAAAGAAAVIAVGSLAHRRGLTTIPRLVAGVVSGPIVLVTGLLATYALWMVLVVIRPGYAALSIGDIGDTYRPTLFRWAVVLLVVGVLLAWIQASRRRPGAAALAVGGLTWPATLGLVTADVAPGLSQLGSLSALAASVGLFAALLLPHGPHLSKTILVAVGVLPGVLLTAGLAWTALGVVGIAGGMGAAMFFLMTGFVAAPLLTVSVGSPPWNRHLVPPRHPLLAPTLVLAMGAVVAAVGLAVDRFDRGHPVQAHLAYVLDHDLGSASWVSEDPERASWTFAYVPQASGNDGPPVRLPYASNPNWWGPAPAADLEAPVLSVLDHTTDRDVSRVDLELRSPRAADVLVLTVDAPVAEASVVVADETVPLPPPSEATGDEPWPYELRFYDPPETGLRVSLSFRGADLPRLALSDITFGLQDLEGFSPRPPGVVSANEGARLTSDSVVVRRTYD